MLLMTEHGTFAANGTERVVVSQLHRSPGLIFDHDKGRHILQKLIFIWVIPYRGLVRLELITSLIYIRIDRRRNLYVSILLKSLGMSLRKSDIFMNKKFIRLIKKAFIV